MLHGLLIAWMMMSVTRQGVQVGHCVGMTRTRCNRWVLTLQRSASNGEAGLSLVFSPGSKLVLQGTLLQYSLVGCIFVSRYHYILRKVVSSFNVFQTVLPCFFFNNPLICLFLTTNFYVFVLISQYHIYKIHLSVFSSFGFYISLFSWFLVVSLYPFS